MNAEDRPEPHLVTRRWLLSAGLTAGVAGALGIGAAWRSDAAPAPRPYLPPIDNEQPTVPGIPIFSNRSPHLTKYVDALPILPSQDIGGEIVITDALHRFHRDLNRVTSLGFGGQAHHGPILEAHSGTNVPMTFINRIRRNPMADDVDTTLHGVHEKDRTAQPTVIHLHGAPNRPGDDGFPTLPFRPGQRATYTFNNAMPATGLWYHDHSMGTTRLSLYAGLAAPYYIRDQWDTGESDNPLGLPSGVHEVPLIICDKVFYPDGSLRYDGTPTVPKGHWAGGLSGDVMVVNGKAWPNLDVERGIYRLRIVNAGQLNDYRLEFSNRMPFWVIGSDGGLLDKPAYVGALNIAAAERYDVLVDFAELAVGERVELINTMQIAWAGQVNGGLTIREVMQFTAGKASAPVRSVPHQLRGATSTPAALSSVPKPRTKRTVTMNVTLNQNNPSWLGVLAMNLNNLPFDTDDFEHPVQGTTEQWDFVNADATMQSHAMHLHLVQFRVLGRHDYNKIAYLAANPPPLFGTRWTPDADRFVTGPLRPPAPYEAGWKDTVRCPPNKITRVIVRWPTATELGFDPDAPFTGPTGGNSRGYVWHCHLTDHEDNEMMQRMRIVAPGHTPSDDNPQMPFHGHG